MVFPGLKDGKIWIPLEFQPIWTFICEFQHGLHNRKSLLCRLKCKEIWGKRMMFQVDSWFKPIRSLNSNFAIVRIGSKIAKVRVI